MSRPFVSAVGSNKRLEIRLYDPSGSPADLTVAGTTVTMRWKDTRTGAALATLTDVALVLDNQTTRPGWVSYDFPADRLPPAGFYHVQFKRVVGTSVTYYPDDGSYYEAEITPVL